MIEERMGEMCVCLCLCVTEVYYWPFLLHSRSAYMLMCILAIIVVSA